jgi:hypothetical protein
VLAQGCVDFQGVGETYGQDRDGADGACKDDEYGAAEQQHQRQPAPQRGVYAPKKLLAVSKNNALFRLLSLPGSRTGSGIDSK